jgi:hypothetical protein
LDSRATTGGSASGWLDSEPRLRWSLLHKTMVEERDALLIDAITHPGGRSPTPAQQSNTDQQMSLRSR